MKKHTVIVTRAQLLNDTLWEELMTRVRAELAGDQEPTEVEFVLPELAE